MTIATIDAVPPELVRGRGGGGPASTRTVVAYGFWIFILSDITMFSAPVRRLRGAVGPDRRRTDRTRGDQSPPRLHRDHVPLGFELHLRARGIVRGTAAAGALSGLCRLHFRARRGFSFHRDLRILSAW